MGCAGAKNLSKGDKYSTILHGAKL